MRRFTVNRRRVAVAVSAVSFSMVALLGPGLPHASAARHIGDEGECGTTLRAPVVDVSDVQVNLQAQTVSADLQWAIDVCASTYRVVRKGDGSSVTLATQGIRPGYSTMNVTVLSELPRNSVPSIVIAVYSEGDDDQPVRSEPGLATITAGSLT